MARVSKGYTRLSVVVPVETADALEDLHWSLRRETDDLLSEAIVQFVADAAASVGK